MKPHNLAERNRNFRNFLIFFTITIVLVATTVYSGTRVPFEENDQLRAELDSMKKQQLFAADFTEVMDKTLHLLDTISIAGVRSELIDGSISININQMQSMISSNPSLTDKKMFNNMISALSGLREAKKEIRKGTDQALRNEELQKEINKLQYENDKLYNRLTEYSRQQQ